MRLASGIVFSLLCAVSASADDVRVVVHFHGDADPGLFAKFGGRGSLALGGAAAGYVPAGQVEALRRSPGVAFVEEDLIKTKTDVPNDTYYNYTFGKNYENRGYNDQEVDFNLIRAPEAWSVATGDTGLVAVLDTGVDTDHPDLAGKIASTANFTSETSAEDVQGHGTHTAGTIAAATNNGKGVAGAGWNAKVAVGKVLDDAGSGYDSWIAAGIDWAWRTAGARVISMSLGGVGTSAVLDQAVQAAWDNNALCIAAAGNDGVDGANHYPSAHPKCMAVAAVNQNGGLASFSNYGAVVDVAAPGVNVLSTMIGGYGWSSGTSMACPHVAGVAALVLDVFPGHTNQQVWDQLVKGSTIVSGHDFPILDAYKAVTVTVLDSTPPAAPTGLAAEGSSRIDLDWADNIEPDLAGYNVYRSSGGSPFALIAAGVASSAYADTAVAASTTYDYVVTAKDASGNESAASAVASATTSAAPAGLSVLSISPNVLAAKQTHVGVVVSGSGFAPGASVTFEGGSGSTPSAATTAVAPDGTSVTVTVTIGGGGPPRNRIWTVRVTNPGGATGTLPGGLTVTP